MCTFIAMGVLAAGVIMWASIMTARFPGTTQLSEIRNGFWERCTGEPFPTTAVDARAQNEKADRVIAYIERVVDRQINKVRGILPFNSIIIAVFSFENAKLQPPHDPVIFNVNVRWLMLFVILGLAISNALCLKLFFVRWATAREYAFFHNEFANGLDVILRRSKVTEWAIIISFTALITGAVLVALIELGIK